MAIGGISGSQPDFSAMRAKIDERMSARFAQSDSNQSGGLSFDEFSSAHANRGEGPNGAGGSPPNGPKGGGGPRGAGGPPPGGTKGAGGASEAENISSLETLFASIDKDEDGEITQDEMKAAKPPKAPPPHGSFSNDMMNTLLSAQEEANSSVVNLLNSFNQSDDEDEDASSDLLSALAA